MSDVTIAPTDKLSRLLLEKKAAREFVERRHEDWDSNSELYRNKVKTNRLTQRQAVNIPLMKETIKTLLSKIDEPPTVEWKEMGGDQEKELILQEIWNQDYDRLNLEGIDIQDKKTVMLFGRAFKKLNWTKEGFEVLPLDIYDVVVDPLINPVDLESARFIIHQNIFRSLKDILADSKYSETGKSELRTFLTSDEGMIVSGKAKKDFDERNQRLKDMGVNEGDIPDFAGSDVLVNLTEHFTKVWNESTKEFERRVIIYANDTVELLDETLTELLGVDFYPFVTWGDDVETNDFWSDGVADLVRTPNKVVNVWFSQLVENRTLRNFQMHWYDATVQGFVPQTYEPGPGRMLPAPGDPNRTIMPVNIQGLDETLQAIDFVTRIIERGSAATAIDKGVGQTKRSTLGEVELLIGKSMERTVTITKFYRRSWVELAEKWYRLLHENQSKQRILYKLGRDGRMWPKTVFPGDWRSDKGFKPMVRSSSERDSEHSKSFQRFELLFQQFPNNQPLKRIGLKHMLEIEEFTPEELREIEEAQKVADLQQQQLIQQQLSAQQPPITPAPATPNQTAAPTTPVASPGADRLKQRLAQFGSMQHA